jgi:hypothetical protein
MHGTIVAVVVTGADDLFLAVVAHEAELADAIAAEGQIRGVEYAQATVETWIDLAREDFGAVRAAKASIAATSGQGDVGAFEIVLVAETVVGAKVSVRAGAQRHVGVASNAARRRIGEAVVAQFLAGYLLARVVATLAAVLLHAPDTTRWCEIIIAAFHSNSK